MIKNTIYFKPITESEVLKYINKLDPTKSTKSNCSPTKFIKLSAQIIAPTLTLIINDCIQNNIFPDRLKAAEVVPIYKKGNKTLPSNYRPISLLSPFSKIFERYLHTQITNFINKNNILHQYQYGFRELLSTDLALAQISKDISDKMEESKYTCSVFIDLAKAFDTVDHSILLSKLYNYGLRGNAAKLILDYLTNRTQTTIINGIKSNPEKITCGVPQGSILGPLLFILFINDLPNQSNLTTRLFADDACLSYSHKNPTELENIMNKELVIINNWIKSNKLTINYSKSNFIIFANKIRKHKFNIHMDGNTLEQVKSTRYLGVVLDEKLNWKEHIKTIQSKISRGSYILSKIRHYVDFNTLKMLYFSLIYPHLNYCITSWGGISQSVLLPLFKLQKKIIRIITFSAYDSASAPLFNKLKFLPLNHIYQRNILILIHKIHKKLIPVPPQLIFIQDIHNHNTRLSSKQNYFQHFNKLKIGQYSYLTQGLKLWRNIPNDFKNIPVLPFKNKIKNYLLGLLIDDTQNC